MVIDSLWPDDFRIFLFRLITNKEIETNSFHNLAICFVFAQLLPFKVRHNREKKRVQEKTFYSISL